MGISYTLLKGIPSQFHLDSFELKNLETENKTDLTVEEYLAAEKKYFESLGTSSGSTQYTLVGEKWKGFFTDAKEVVLREIAFSGEPYVHLRGRYDRLTPEVAQEFEQKLLKDYSGEDWERVFRFKSNKVDETQPVGLISILEHPAMGPDNSQNAQDIFCKLVERATFYDAELISVYGRGDFAKQWPFRETESGLVVADRSQENGPLIVPVGVAPHHVDVERRYARILPPKERCMFFSFTAYNNSLLD